MRKIHVIKPQETISPGSRKVVYSTEKRSKLAFYILKTDSPDLTIITRVRVPLPNIITWEEVSFSLSDLYGYGLVNNMCPNPKLPCISVWDDTNRKYVVIFSPTEGEEFPHGFELVLRNPTSSRVTISMVMVVYEP